MRWVAPKKRPVSCDRVEVVEVAVEADARCVSGNYRLGEGQVHGDGVWAFVADEDAGPMQTLLDARFLVVAGVGSAPESRVGDVGERGGGAVGELEWAFVARDGRLW